MNTIERERLIERLRAEDLKKPKCERCGWNRSRATKLCDRCSCVDAAEEIKRILEGRQTK